MVFLVFAEAVDEHNQDPTENSLFFSTHFYMCQNKNGACE